MSGFANQPKILRGAFVEYGISIPPLIVPFQFNPVSVSRNRSNSFSVPSSSQDKDKDNKGGGGGLSLREFHQNKEFESLSKLRDAQDVRVEPEKISIEVRFDATDKLNEGDAIAEQFGITPELSTLELMMYPKSESLLGAAISALLGEKPGHVFTGTERPPMVLFIWGRKKVLPVNINSMGIKEEEFSTDLNPIRAIVSVDMTVIEGPNLPYLYSKGMKEAMSVLNIANIPDIVNVVIPL